MKNTLEIKNLCYSIDSKTILDNVSLSLESGQIGALLGPSGSGKTSLLRMIAGLIDPASGQILLNGESIAKADLSSKRPATMVFQDLGLFPHLSVYDNVAYGLAKSTKTLKPQIRAMLEKLGLFGMESRYPHELSGGQQQRVALARALMIQPKILLLDEPFSNLDPCLRVILIEDLIDILKAQDIIVILVTHDREEALAMGDFIGVIGEHVMQQWDRPEQILQSPANAFVTRFTGHNALISGELNSYSIQTCMGELKVKNIESTAGSGMAKALIRSIDAQIADDGLNARIIFKTFDTDQFVYTLELDNKETIFAVDRQHGLEDKNIGDPVKVILKSPQVMVYSE